MRAVPTGLRRHEPSNELADPSWRGSDKRREIRRLEAGLEALSRRDPQRAEGVRVRLGDLHRELGGIEPALHYYRSVVESEPSREARVRAHTGAARTLLRTDDLEQAMVHTTSAIEIARRSGSAELMALALSTRGLVSFESASFEDALHDLHEAMELAKAIHETTIRTEALLHVGFVRSDSGEDWKAIGAFQTALEWSRESSDRTLEALALLGLGHTYSKLGEKQRAMEHYVLAEPIVEAMEDPVRTASLATGLGYLYTELGDYENAERYYRRAVALNEVVQSRWGRAANLIHLARLHSARERPEKAVSAFHSAIADLKKLPDRGMEAAILGELASVLDRLGRRDEAEEAHAQALEVVRDRSGLERSQAELLNDLSAFELRRGRVAEARRHSRKALLLSRKTRSRFAEVEALSNLARAERAVGELHEALETAESALALVEELRTTISSYRLRSSFVASVHELQELQVSLLMDLDLRHPGAGFDRRAFLAAELAKARSLLDHLWERDVVEGDDPSLLRERERLRRLVAERAAAWDHSRRGRSKDVPDELEEAVVELDRVETVLRGRARARKPTDVRPLTAVAEIQREFLDGDTALLSYFLGREHGYLWIVTQSSFSAHRLPSSARIGSAARWVHELLSKRARRPGETARAHRERVLEEEREFGLVAEPLADWLLGDALVELDARRLVIAADGALHKLPFSVLPLPRADAAELPLVARYEIVRLASASVWSALRARSPSRTVRPKQLAVVADPVFDAGDPRVSPLASELGPSADPPPAGAACPEPPGGARSRVGLVPAETGSSALPRLLSTRQEAQAIASLLSPEARLRALGFRANRSLVTGGELAEYDVVHFATHGVLSESRPELSGIALSLVGPNGRPENGFLRLDDIEQLDLPVRLVVLSACSTALGKEVLGEGVVSLVGGFLTAGADGVVASYWEVEDEATAELMESFYAGLFSERLSAPAALQRAQKSLLGHGRFDSPYYFGAFEFHGSWR